MSLYREQFNIPGLAALGIEDHEQPGKHFFTELMGNYRFQTWHGGCGIGKSTTIQAAHTHIHEYARYDLKRQIFQLQAKLAIVESSFAALGDDVFNLAKFLVK